MTQAFRRASTVVLMLAFASGPIPRAAAADDTIAKVKKVTALSTDPKEAKEVSYPTPLAQLVPDQGDPQNVKKDTQVLPGQAVLTRSANTYLKMDKELEALLYSDTFVRFDGLNVWLLRHGKAYVVAKRGRLEIVAEALGRVLVNSEVYLRSDGSVLLVYVAEGHVVLEAAARTLALGAGQAGTIPLGEGPQERPLTPEEKAEISRDIETAKHVMKSGGGGGGVAVAAALAAIIAGAAIASSGGGGGGTGGDTSHGTQGLPDLVPDGSRGGCRRDDNGNVLITVRNQGQANAPDSITQVAFEQDPAFARRSMIRDAPPKLTTPGLRSGAATQLVISSAPRQSFSLRVTVDANQRVRESNEDNNTALINCPGLSAIQ